MLLKITLKAENIEGNLNPRRFKIGDDLIGSYFFTDIVYRYQSPISSKSTE